MNTPMMSGMIPPTSTAAPSVNGHHPNGNVQISAVPVHPATAPAPQTTIQPDSEKQEPGAFKRFGMGVLLGVVMLLLAVVVFAPIALSSGDLIQWAGSPRGLGLGGWWPWLVFIALDCAAAACILLSIYRAILGEGAGVFGILVWVFAGFSGLANYRHGSVPGAPDDAWWFFPVMSILGPGLLEAVMHFVRRVVRIRSGEQSKALPKFGLIRWLPLIGAPKDTFGARRAAQILQIRTVDEAVATYHALCPDGSLGVVKAIRARDVAAAVERDRVAKLLADEAVKAERAAVRSAAAGGDQSSDQRATSRATSRPSTATIRAAVGTGGRPTIEATTSGDHSELAVADAATIRAQWPDGLPDRGAQRQVRNQLGWHAGKATNALRAYQDRADLAGPAPEAIP